MWELNNNNQYINLNLASKLYVTSKNNEVREGSWNKNNKEVFIIAVINNKEEHLCFSFDSCLKAIYKLNDIVKNLNNPTVITKQDYENIGVTGPK